MFISIYRSVDQAVLPTPRGRAPPPVPIQAGWGSDLLLLVAESWSLGPLLEAEMVGREPKRARRASIGRMVTMPVHVIICTMR